MIEIPLTNNPEQSFTITLDETVYTMRVILNSRVNLWSLSIAIGVTDILNGIELVSGVDILGAHNLGISNMFIIDLDNSSNDPDGSTMGVSSKLFILTDEELPS